MSRGSFFADHMEQPFIACIILWRGLSQMSQQTAGCALTYHELIPAVHGD